MFSKVRENVTDPCEPIIIDFASTKLFKFLQEIRYDFRKYDLQSPKYESFNSLKNACRKMLEIGLTEFENLEYGTNIF